MTIDLTPQKAKPSALLVDRLLVLGSVNNAPASRSRAAPVIVLGGRGRQNLI
jgi:hypothetical protein